MLRKTIVLLLALGVVPSSATTGDRDGLDDLFGIGRISGQVGVNFRVDDAENKELVDDDNSQLDYQVYAGGVSMRF